MEYNNSQAREAINEWIHDKMHRRIMKLRFVHGYTMEEIAGEVHMSDRQVKRIVKKNEDILFRHMKNPV